MQLNTQTEKNSSKTPIYLDANEAKEFLYYRENKQQIHQAIKLGMHNLTANWQELISFAKLVDHGQFMVTVKNGIPVKANKAIQQIVFGIKL